MNQGMLLPGSLDRTTLGDVLGTLHRGRATGFLELSQRTRSSYVFLSSGKPTAVASDGPTLGQLLLSRGLVGASDLERAAMATRSGDRLVGEALLDDGVVDASTIDGAMAAQTAERLDALYVLSNAKLRFHVVSFGTERPPIPLRAAFASPQLHPAVFLFGRPRARVRTRAKELDARRDALRSLGLEVGASSDDIRRAFKRLVMELHPDRAEPGADRDELGRRLARITAAYARLSR